MLTVTRLALGYETQHPAVNTRNRKRLREKPRKPRANLTIVHVPTRTG